MRPNRLIELRRSNQTIINGWLTIPSPLTAELMAHEDFDSLLVDMQHGLIGFDTAVSMLQAISTTNTVPLIRVQWNDPGLLMRALDAGAYGVICPMISTRQQAEAFVSACRYPPLGSRSYGPARALIYGGDDYVQQANDTVLTIALIETKEAIENLEEIASVEGLSGLYVGPSDLSFSLGLAKRADFDDPRLIAATDHVLEVAAKYNLLTGVQAGNVENAIRQAARGFNMVTPLTDITVLQMRSRELVAQTRNGVKA
ncbi:MAG: putative aldolase [Chloroflexi bacterium OLB15]|nr:MAG: putative aldolase [Chloroflexi bacterium OLB15]